MIDTTRPAIAKPLPLSFLPAVLANPIALKITPRVPHINPANIIPTNDNTNPVIAIPENFLLAIGSGTVAFADNDS